MKPPKANIYIAQGCTYRKYKDMRGNENHHFWDKVISWEIKEGQAIASERGRPPSSLICRV